MLNVLVPRRPHTTKNSRMVAIQNCVAGACDMWEEDSRNKEAVFAGSEGPELLVARSHVQSPFLFTFDRIPNGSYPLPQVMACLD